MRKPFGRMIISDHLMTGLRVPCECGVGGSTRQRPQSGAPRLGSSLLSCNRLRLPTCCCRARRGKSRGGAGTWLSGRGRIVAIGGQRQGGCTHPKGWANPAWSCAGADQVRAGHQPQDCQNAWSRSAAHLARPRRRGDRMKRRAFIGARPRSSNASYQPQKRRRIRFYC